MENFKDLTKSDIELIVYCLRFTKESLDRIPLQQFNKIFKGKLSKAQYTQEFTQLLLKLS